MFSAKGMIFILLKLLFFKNHLIIWLNIFSKIGKMVSISDFNCQHLCST